MKRSIREATTEELIDALSGRAGIEYISTDKDERCQITVESKKDGRLPGHLYRSTGRYGPEVIIRYVPPPEGGS